MHIIYLLQFLCGKLAHCLISLRIEMQPVVRILSLQTLRVFRIAGQLIEIDDLVEGTTFSDPFVHGLSHCLVPERIPAVSLGWGDGSAIHLDSLCLGFRYQHLVAGNQGICYMLIISAAATDIVGSLEDDEFIYTCLSQDITVKRFMAGSLNPPCTTQLPPIPRFNTPYGFSAFRASERKSVQRF